MIEHWAIKAGPEARQAKKQRLHQRPKNLLNVKFPQLNR
jgi:hypothetical protein